jgi:hypothetical protein
VWQCADVILFRNLKGPTGIIKTMVQFFKGVLTQASFLDSLNGKRAGTLYNFNLETLASLLAITVNRISTEATLAACIQSKGIFEHLMRSVEYTSV